MTDSLKIQKLKSRINTIIGEKDYQRFLNKLASSIEPMRNIALEFGLSESTITYWRTELGYKDGKTRSDLRFYKRRIERIKQREKRTQSLINCLFKNNKV